MIVSLESSETASQDISYTVSTVEADSTSLSTNPFSSHTDTDLSEGIYLHLFFTLLETSLYFKRTFDIQIDIIIDIIDNNLT